MSFETSLETVEIEATHDGRVARVTVNRPDALNALNRQVLEDLHLAATRISETEIDAVVLTGAGRAFVAGADIKAMIDYSPDEAQKFSKLGHRAMSAIAGLPMPVVAAVNGFALGGGLELALSADLLIASTRAKLGLPEVGLSVIPGWGGTQRLGRLIGWHHAKHLVFTGKIIGAEDAREIGLVLDVYEQDGFLDQIDEFVGSIISNGPLALRAAKIAMREGADATLAEGLAIEEESFGRLFGSNDQKEGMQAFIEKREPDFTRS